MRIMNVYAAKTHLSRLLQQVAMGEKIVITRAGKPVAKLMPYQTEERPREPGCWCGQVRIAADFDTLPEALARAFHGETP